MTDKEFEELEIKYKAELIRRKRVVEKQETIERLKSWRESTPSIKIRNKTMPLNEYQREQVCDFIIKLLEEEE